MNESNFSLPTKLCPNPERWTTRDEMATENQVLELVHGLVLGLQPDYVLESGSYRGDGSAVILRAIKTNGVGFLHTIEIEPRLADETADRLKEYDQATWKITNSPACAVLLPAGTHIDLAFIDSGRERHLEFLHFSKWMSQKTIVVFHDSAEKFIQYRPFYDKLAEDGYICPVYLPTPRGLAICQVLKTAKQ